MSRRSKHDDDELLSGLQQQSNSSKEIIGLTGSQGARIASLEEDGEDEDSKITRTDRRTDDKSEADDEDDRDDRQEGKSARAASIESAWQNSLESSEMIDDPVRMYLREIGRVSLLKAAEERILARKMEAAKYIQDVEDELTSPEGRPPRAWQVVLHLLGRACDSEQLLDALSRYVGHEREGTFNELVSDPRMRKPLDGDLPEEMLLFMGDVLNKDPLEAKADIQALSLDSASCPGRSWVLWVRIRPLKKQGRR